MKRLTASSSGVSKLHILTPNQKQTIIRKERERRRLCRYTQVRQQSVEIASRIRENVKLAKEKEVAEIKKKVTDAIVQRAASRTDSSPIHLSPIEVTLPKSRRECRKLTNAQIQQAIRRHQEALKKLRCERLLRKQARQSALQRRRMAEREATSRCRSIERPDEH